MTYKITTVMGLPGSGKSRWCKERAPKGVGQGPGFWRPEPTDDLPWLAEKLLPAEVNQVIQERFIAQDNVLNGAQWRDSDVWTSFYTFSKYRHNLPLPSELFIPPIPQALVLLKISPELQEARIKTRAREGLWNSELKYCKPTWHQRIKDAFEAHPAKVLPHSFSL
jgi:hypothetical protein